MGKKESGQATSLSGMKKNEINSQLI